MAEKQLKITSFNCKGFKPRNYDYVNDLYKACDILFLQETWLYNFEFNQFSNNLQNCQYHAMSAMDESDITRVGRPYGGLAIIWKNNLALSITPIKTINPRLCAVMVKSNNLNIIMCNLYLPCDDNTDVNFELYGETLYDLINIIDTYRGFDLIIGGDLNTDFNRNESRNLDLLNQFINDELLNCISLELSSNNFTFQNSRGNKSFIDHFIVSESLNQCNVAVSYDGNNLSDHNPITLNTTCSSTVIHNNNITKHIIEWDKATDIHLDNYKTLLNHYFREFDINIDILECNNFNCKHHTEHISQKLEEFIDIIKCCANSTIPNKVLRGKRGIKDWNVFVAPYKEKSIFWNDVWKSAGRPAVGQLANLRRFSRNKYHWAVRKAKRDDNKFFLSVTAEQLANKSFREFWNTIRKIKGINRISSNVIDGVSNDQNIVDNFKDIYSELYNSVPDNDFKTVVNEVNTLVSNKCSNNMCSSAHCHDITIDILSKAIDSLKNGKADETHYLSSDHFIHGSRTTMDILRKLLNSMLKHGIASETINKSVIKPIPKDMQKSLSVSSNYRAISKNTIISKIIDYVIILQIQDKLCTSSYQFAYKKGFSTSMCSFLVAETIQYYKSHGSDVYMLSLDASKAFDRVKYTKLFKLLIDKLVCPLIIRLLMNIYLSSSATVKWKNCESENFGISNGVKQGAVISPPLFAIYLDPLIARLIESKEGCHIGDICANAFVYADDIVLLSPSCNALRNLINICEYFANEYEINFNPNKCTLLIFSDIKDIGNLVNLTICGSSIKNVTSETHLGHVFQADYGHTMNLINFDHIIRDMKVRTNAIVNQFKPISWKAKTTLFNSQCLYLYGCPLWRLDDPKIEELNTTWKVCCRKLLNLNPRTRSRYIHQLMDTPPIIDTIMYRMLSFYISGLNSKDPLISNTFKNSLLSNTSYMKVNLNKILEHFNIQYLDIFNINKYTLKKILCNKIGEKEWQCVFLQELLSVREGTLIVDMEADLDEEEEEGLDIDEIKLMIEMVSTDFLVQ